MRRTKLDGFDGLRALAALTVLTYHVALSRGFAPAGSLAPLLWELKGGVAIFFVISGALLYLPYARAIRDGGDLPGWRAYALRREREDPAGVLGRPDRAGDRPFRRRRVRPGRRHLLRPIADLPPPDAVRRARGGVEPVRRGDLLRAAAGVRLAGGAAGAPALHGACASQLDLDRDRGGWRRWHCAVRLPAR